MDVRKLLLLRKVTRAIQQAMRARLEQHLAALLPLIRPKAVFGDFVVGRVKEMPNFADKAFAEFTTHYQSVAEAKPFQLPKELRPPLELVISPLELTPVETSYVADSGGDKKTITLTMPLNWVLTYPGCSPQVLREAMAQRNAQARVQEIVIHDVALNMMLKKQPGFVRLLEALRFSVSQTQIPDFANLPVTVIGCPVTTMRPPDEVIIENTEVSGMDVFEEVVNLEDVFNMQDKMKEELVELVKGFGDDLLPA